MWTNFAVLRGGDVVPGTLNALDDAYVRQRGRDANRPVILDLPLLKVFDCRPQGIGIEYSIYIEERLMEVR